ncbi:hypothetical protein Ancab_020096, partial [Ancistrocladus abbreviatus]
MSDTWLGLGENGPINDVENGPNFFQGWIMSSCRRPVHSTDELGQNNELNCNYQIITRRGNTSLTKMEITHGLRNFQTIPLSSHSSSFLSNTNSNENQRGEKKMSQNIEHWGQIKAAKDESSIKE